MKSYKDFIVELFDKPAKLEYSYSSDSNRKATFYIDDWKYSIRGVYLAHDDKYFVDFGLITSHGKSLSWGKTDLGVRVAGIVLATAMKFIEDLIEDTDPRMIEFSAVKSDNKDDIESRVKLYTSMVKRYTPKKYKIDIRSDAYATDFILTRK